MNTLVDASGPAALAQLRAAAVALGCTEYIAPATVTYYRGPKTQTYNPDTGLGTATWGSTASLTSALVGHFNWNVIANVQNVESTDVQILFAQSSLAGAPTDDDECSYNSQTYKYVGHKAAVDLYLVHFRIKQGAA
ncbi:MAG: hypothetical protein M0R22_08590 [Dehalococcoidia bacterium]|nr:hypothetical protein [Dehalococcoidia bacterium]